MPRVSRLSQADLERAVRAIRKEFGSAIVVFDPDGTVRVVPADGQPENSKKLKAPAKEWVT